jgi:hypothetical protein
MWSYVGVRGDGVERRGEGGGEEVVSVIWFLLGQHVVRSLDQKSTYGLSFLWHDVLLACFWY